MSESGSHLTEPAETESEAMEMFRIVRAYVRPGGPEMRPRYQQVLRVLQRLWEFLGDGPRPGYPRNQPTHLNAIQEEVQNEENDDEDKDEDEDEDEDEDSSEDGSSEFAGDNMDATRRLRKKPQQKPKSDVGPDDGPPQTPKRKKNTRPQSPKIIELFPRAGEKTISAALGEIYRHLGPKDVKEGRVVDIQDLLIRTFNIDAWRRIQLTMERVRQASGGVNSVTMIPSNKSDIICLS